MTVGFAAGIMRDSIFQILLISAPILLVGMTVGLIISIFQATTSIQEQTLTFVPKIIAIFLTIVFFGPWMLTSMRQFTLNIMSLIAKMNG
ncbi:MAG: flagellar biosynthetic protein FliQ [Spirochaetes bacterium]|nr:MAG: flagellar biosynthetic protein FliQ [Spirochaetota bacterium]